MLTNMATLAAFLATEGIEGFRLKAYDDATGKTLEEGDEAIGKPTIAAGITRYSDGEWVEPGDELDVQEAFDETFRYLDQELAPSFKRLIKVDLPEHRQHAFASWLYNFGEEKAKSYTLPKLINTGASDREIILKWMEYVFAQGERKLGLYRRRMAEVLMWMDLEWRAALNVTFDDDVFAVIKRLGGAVDGADMDLFNELEIPKRGAARMEPKNDDPTPDTPMTLDDAQYLSAKAAGYTGTFSDFMGHRSEVKAKAPPPKGPAPAPAPKPLKREDVKYGIHDPEEVGYKPMTMAKRYKGQRDIDMGKVTAGVGTGAAALASIAGNMEKVDKSITAMNPWFLIIGLVGTAIVVGAILMWHGANLKHRGREEASQPMV